MSSNDDAAKKLDAKLLKLLLTPSWLSGLIAVTVGLVITVGVILAFSFNHSQIQSQLSTLQSTPSSQPALTLPGQNPPGTTSISLQNTWPLLLFWCAVGLVVYFIMETIYKLLTDARRFVDELNYVHANRDKLIKTTAEYLGVRVLAAVLWLIFANLFLKRIIPYSLESAHTSAIDIKSLSGLGYAFLAFVMIALSLQLHTIFLRLVVRRPRVFSRINYA